jgi:hypothetical protein
MIIVMQLQQAPVCYCTSPASQHAGIEGFVPEAMASTSVGGIFAVWHSH